MALAERIEPFRPSNGDHGDWFQSEFCERCINDAAVNRGGDDPDWSSGCQILARALACGIQDADYPKEWVRIDGEAQCTAFVEDVGQKWPADPTPEDLERAGQMRLFE